MSPSRAERAHTLARRCALAWSLWLVSGGAPGAVLYEVTASSDLSVLTVTARFDARLPRELEAQDPSARNFLGPVLINGERMRSNSDDGRRIRLPAAADALSISYQVDLRAIARAGRLGRFAPAVTDAVLASAELWLWLPAGERDPITLRFQLPEGMSVSAPWPESIAADGSKVFCIDGNGDHLPALIAIGRIRIQPVPVPGSTLRLALVDGKPAPDPQAVRDWIAEGAAAVAGAYGRFPVPAPQILVVPMGSGPEPVPWGQVLRGGGPAAHLFIDQTRPVFELREDWVLVHELSHLLHPNLRREGLWLAEGLATYYQNVLRARSGLQSGAQAWQKLHEGFQRGLAQTRSGVTLVEATRDMLGQRLFMRVYWSGAAIALLADLELRRNGGSLDQVLSAFRDCCLARPRSWEVAEFLGTLDGIAGRPVFLPLHDRYYRSDRFPELGAAYSALGLEAAEGRVVGGGDAAARALRNAIMEPIGP